MWWRKLIPGKIRRFLGYCGMFFLTVQDFKKMYKGNFKKLLKYVERE